MRVLVAGATGAFGTRLVPALVAAGHLVHGTTRTQGGVAALRAAGAEGLVMDALDGEDVRRVVEAVGPEVVVDELTALRGGTDLRRFDDSYARTNLLRTAGTDHLLAAARAAGVRRVVAASYTGWPNTRTGGAVKTEEDALDLDPAPNSRRALAAIRHLEEAVTRAGGVEGLVLRYGTWYGPGTAIAPGGELAELVRARRLPVVGGGTGVWSLVHVDDAVAATVLALDHGRPGLYNVVDDDPAPVSEVLAALARAVGARDPLHVPAWLVRPVLGAHGVSMMTRVRGSSNAKARRELDWVPRFSSWRDGFPAVMGRGAPVPG
jgi:nucleoside-diphosphate-sugar epimerase